jgi:GTPase SAR1 family protein
MSRIIITIITYYYLLLLGILLVYDITNEESFQNTRNWMRQIEQNCSRQIDMVLVGNKTDMTAQRVSLLVC